MNAITTPANNNMPMSVADLTSALRAGVSADTRKNSLHLKFSKGDWLYGADANEPSEDARFGINPFGILRGYIAWGDGAVVNEVMKGLTEGEVRKSDLPDIPGEAKWAAQIGVELMGVAGTERGLNMVFASSSSGGVKELSKLIEAIAARAESGAPDFVPVVRLDSASYVHKTYGRVKTPVLEITDWCSMDDTLDAYEEKMLGEAMESPAEESIFEDAAEDPAPRSTRRAFR